MYKANISEKQDNWGDAYKYYIEAQKYDVSDEQLEKNILYTKKQKAYRDADRALNNNDIISFYLNSYALILLENSPLKFFHIVHQI